MTVGSTPITSIPRPAQDAFRQFFVSAWNMANMNWNIREQLRQKDLAYMREQDYTPEQWKARLANMAGDPSKFQNVTVPIILPQVEAFVSHMQSVFLQGHPIFGVVSDPSFEDAALQMEAIIEENAITGSWGAELLMWFRDGAKYNISALECTWETRTVPRIETDLNFSAKEGKPTQINWSGNVLRRWDMYNTFWDSRVAPRDIPEKAEFVGKTELASRVALKKFISQLPGVITNNLPAAFESGVDGTFSSFDKFYVPYLNPWSILSSADPRATTDWMLWAGLTTDTKKGIQYKNMYQINTVYARIIPSDFNLRVPAANTPQVWKLIFVNGQVLIHAERQTNAHDLIPVFFHQPMEDGLDYQTKSFQDNLLPFQQLGSAIANAEIAAQRRAISDRVIYDPSKIDAKEINNPSPTAKIPVRSAHYGKNLAEAVYPFPYRDDQAGTRMQQLQQMFNFANMIAGQNQAQQGQFVKGNKTLHEYADVMANANGRNQCIARGYEERTFSKVKEVIKLNILQYQQGATIYSQSQQQNVEVDPVKLRQAVTTFKISDGLLPSDKIINADTFGAVMQYGLSNPAIQAEYNFNDLFSYLMKMQGADLKPFQKSKAQLAYEQAVQQWQQVMMAAIQQGQQPPNIPQPTPEQFGYDPNNRVQQSASQQQRSILEQVIGTAALGTNNPNSPAQAGAVRDAESQALQQSTSVTMPPSA